MGADNKGKLDVGIAKAAACAADLAQKGVKATSQLLKKASEGLSNCDGYMKELTEKSKALLENKEKALKENQAQQSSTTVTKKTVAEEAEKQEKPHSKKH